MEASLKDWAKIYAERLNKANRNERVSEFKKIESEINGLINTQTKEGLSNEAKVVIYEGIRSELKTQAVGFSKSAGPVFECANDELMVLIDMALRSLGGK